ncbi:histidine phosphatase family protein [Citrobacter enshiensis]|uniref:Histidine phosphatase family protein n=1 Tax=Citrobacter enshiensis TaxID=2971264 RepID=A0ABT8PSV1_9ENTR|nr:histidine phosphatase family protein [Citrobacter enshiensis]MDN8599414.1 histidine phosphatase family protein [Citrobacter enshiensis]WET42056.1 histidine phosphatase family protein [Citrobacter enshiensis]
MLALTLSSVKSKKYIAILMMVFVILAGLSTRLAWSSNGLQQIDNETLAAIAQHHPVVVLFRHAERCDRSSNECLSDKAGITVNGANNARERGNAFSAKIKDYDLYSSDAIRTIQSATWFSADKTVTVDKNMQECGHSIYRSIEELQAKSQNKNVVIFTHNHCLAYIAKDKRGVKFEPDYLDALVMHSENGKLILDGELVSR